MLETVEAAVVPLIFIGVVLVPCVVLTEAVGGVLVVNIRTINSTTVAQE